MLADILREIAGDDDEIAIDSTGVETKELSALKEYVRAMVQFGSGTAATRGPCS